MPATLQAVRAKCLGGCLGAVHAARRTRITVMATIADAASVPDASIDKIDDIRPDHESSSK